MRVDDTGQDGPAAHGVVPSPRRWPVLLLLAGALTAVLGGVTLSLLHPSPWAVPAGGALMLAGCGALALEVWRAHRRSSALRHSEQRLRDLATASNDWHWEMDADLRFTYLSKRFERAFGVTRAEAIGRRREEMLSDDNDPDMVAAHVADMEAQRPFRDFLYRFRRPDGTIGWCQVSGIPVYTEDGRFVGYRGTASDVTDHQRAEVEAQANRDRLRDLTDHIPGAVYQFQRDVDGSVRMNFLSAGIRDLAGISPGQALADAQVMFDLIHPDDLPAVRDSIDDAYARVAPWFMEYRLIVEGTVKWVRGQAQPQNLGAGRVIWNGLLTDVTELKRTEDALREQQNRYARAVRGSRDGLWDYDLQTGRVYYSSRFHELLSLPPHTLPETPEAFLDRVHPQDLDTARAQVRAHVKDDAALDLELRVRRADGSYGWYRLRAATERDAAGWALRMAGTLSDICDLKAQERELVRARERAEAANKSKAEFLASMSHELRTPLNAIIGFAEVLEGELLGPLGTPRYRDYAGDIRESGAHLLSLINDILDHAKIEAGRRELHEEWLELPALVRATLRLIKERAEGRRIALDVEVPETLPRLYADARGIKQILINLLTNAVKFTKPGGRVAITASADQDLVIEVVDTGIGIAPDDVERVMTPFGQADNTLTREHEGTGLGLALCRQLADLHGGELQLDSTVGHGTKVRVRLPGERLERLETEPPKTASAG